jgi:hypothetical protein
VSNIGNPLAVKTVSSGTRTVLQLALIQLNIAPNVVFDIERELEFIKRVI